MTDPRLAYSFLFLPLVRCEDFLHEVRRDFLVVGGLDVEVGPAAGYGAEVAGVGEHFDLGHFGLYDLTLAALLDTHRSPAAAGEVAHDVADQLRRCEHLDLHVRFQQHRMGFLDGALEGHRSSDLERILGGVDTMKRAVAEAHLHVNHGVAGDIPAGHRLDDSLLHRRDELARDGAADDAVLELEARTAGQRGELYPRVAELAPAAGLLLVAALGLGRACDRFHKGHLRRPRLDLDPVAILDALQLERGILIDHAPDRVEDLLFLTARPGADGERSRRFGKFDRLEGHRPLRFAKGVEGRRIAELGDGDDVPRDGLVYRVALFADEVRDASQPLRRIGARIGERLVRAAAAAHDPQHAQATGVRVHVGLEYVSGEGAIRVAQDLIALFSDPTLQVGGAWGATGDHVEQAVYANHTLRARREYGNNEALGDPLADPVESLLGGDLLAFEVLFEQRVVALRYGLEELRLGRVYLVFHTLGDLCTLLAVYKGGPAEEPVNAFEVVLASDGQIQWDDGLPKAFSELVYHGPEVRTLPVQVVDDDDVRDAFLLAPAPHALRDDLDRVLGVDYQDRAVGNPLGYEGVPDEAPVSGGVEHIDLASLPLEVGHAHTQRHAPLGLFVGVVEDAARGTASSRSQPDHTLGYRCLAASAVPDQAHVPDGLRLYSHGFLLS